MAVNFESLKITEKMISGLEGLGIKKPTEIQEKVIPLALEGKNLIGQSETGTGKTLSYLLPIIEKIDVNKKEMQCIIIAPTHELVMQIHNTISDLRNSSGIEVSSTPLIGSANVTRQIEKLKSKPHIIVGSSGRILELIKKRKISAHTIKTMVIDEVDKLLDKDNIPSIKEIIKATPKETQIMMFSATITDNTLDVSKTLASDVVVLSVKNTNAVNENIIHGYILTEHRKKIDTLRKLISAVKPKRALVFINSSYDVEKTLEKLRFHNIKVDSVHGSNDKEDRQRALENFRKGSIQVLVASDIAARGLDIKGITHVINLDLPKDSKDYLHRAGRVARAGEIGEVFSLVDPKEEGFIKKYEDSFKIIIPEKYMYGGRVEIQED
ncbi:DEAD/DEAH box helicase [Clostridium algidicarnis]|uniref:Superfamily II DNA/RNA helicase n=2 Tax=Clostridium algidicarnis TaxID=37659 RepID=A0A2S6FZU2_9CLOT|nr:DEAD/DEAH box helicase [Clostridium algidicarnis]MBB6630910.1 DEAD/DEAH box helicase [Clostridium algidicarnis]MBB6696815.1 DEAD/DEAH box helicase [Clostridium algidicarnis]MBU3219399.1 DEAD/DEAH box helicase [Clostridium algidicarnis]MCB2286132.1 DEAD/DEAH box helicase [Clostridium algidicarnis]PPK49165.1 superfamily II DNA/RNA helicase [Clostridium algidicarnis DSM 15099]